MGVGTNIRYLLKEHNKSMQWLSDASEISINTLYSITRKDKSNVRPENLDKIARCFNISVQELTSDKYGNFTEKEEVAESSTDEKNVYDNMFSTNKASNDGAKQNKPRTPEEYGNLDFTLMIAFLEGQLEDVFKENSFYRKIPLQAKQYIASRRRYEIALLRSFHDLPDDYWLTAIQRLHDLYYEILLKDSSVIPNVDNEKE